MGMRELCRAHDRRGIAVAHARDVVAYGSGEELDILREVTDVTAQLPARPGIYVGAVETHHARRWRPSADQQPRKGRFAGRGGTADSQSLTGGPLKGDGGQ